MSKGVDGKVQRIMAAIDREGMPPLSREDWVSVLNAIRSECQSRIVAAREDNRLRHDDRREPPTN